MSWFGDLHIHSRYARATSKDLTLPNLDDWARKKGIKVLGTGDFTHPFWYAELAKDLEPAPEAGLYIRQGVDPEIATRFLLSTEISSIYNQGGKNRRVHTLVMLPSLEATKAFNEALGRRANLRSDGRPIVGLSAKAVAQLAWQTAEAALIIPAHAWTPWFSVFGSASGFDSLEEAFEELAPQILAIETGLSSDPAMNWQLSSLDNVALMSSSDAHSPAKIAREATEFEGELSYAGIAEAFQTGAPARVIERAAAKTKLIGTIEFFPEEGKYHFDGHRVCQVRWHPDETTKADGKCSNCGRPVTIGVLARVNELADRLPDDQPGGAPAFRSLVPLDEIIAETLGAGVKTKGVVQIYERLLQALGNELGILTEAEIAAIAEVAGPVVAEGVKRVREGQLEIAPGYDGEYGTIKIFEKAERDRLTQTPQVSLF